MYLDFSKREAKKNPNKQATETDPNTKFSPVQSSGNSEFLQLAAENNSCYKGKCVRRLS